MRDEAARLGATLGAIGGSALDHATTELILVDDGSTDGTAEVAQHLLDDLDLRGRVVRLPRNVGKGGALQAGVQAASGSVIAFVDADLSTPVDAVIAVFELVETGAADVVTTTRVHPDAVITAFPSRGRRWCGKAFNILVRRLGLTTFNDTQCGLKGFTAEAARTLFADLHVRRFAFDVEVLARARRADLRVVELPVEWRHVDASRVHPVRDGSRMVVDALRIRWLLRNWQPAGAPSPPPAARPDHTPS